MLVQAQIFFTFYRLFINWYSLELLTIVEIHLFCSRNYFNGVIYKTIFDYTLNFILY